MAHVLVVDDYEGFRTAMEFCLPTFGHSAVSCATGAFSVELAASARPDVVVIGVSPSKLAGFLVCDALGSHPFLSSLPIIILANPLTPQIEANATRARVHGLLAKPFEWPALLALLAGASQTA
jgi:CheY-like chemotaxis protein